MPKKNSSTDRWGFFHGIAEVLSAFPHASAREKAAVVGMCLFAVLFIGLGLIGSVVLPAWAVVTMFGLAALLIFGTAGILLLVKTDVSRCRHVPIYPTQDG